MEKLIAEASDAHRSDLRKALYGFFQGRTALAYVLKGALRFGLIRSTSVTLARCRGASQARCRYVRLCLITLVAVSHSKVPANPEEPPPPKTFYD